MRIMITDATDAAATVADALRADGHDVRQECLAGDLGGPACAGLDIGTCALDQHVDVAIAGLGRTADCASAGAVCARRHGVPVVTVGRHDAEHGDLLPALERAATTVDPELRRLVEAELARLAEDLDEVPDVHLHRQPDRVVVEAIMPADASTALASMVAVRLHDALGPRRRWLGVVDVVVRHREPYVR